MKITICGSVKFADKFVEIYKSLEKIGHQPKMHKLMFSIADGTAPDLIDNVNREHWSAKRKHGFIKRWHNYIVNSDAILVLNYDKKGIKNYIGGNTLMEMGFAHVNDKKIFLLNPAPEDVSYVDEIKAMVDVVLEGDLNKIN
jgi:hypothetical protein